MASYPIAGTKVQGSVPHPYSKATKIALHGGMLKVPGAKGKNGSLQRH